MCFDPMLHAISKYYVNQSACSQTQDLADESYQPNRAFTCSYALSTSGSSRYCINESQTAPISWLCSGGTNLAMTCILDSILPSDMSLATMSRRPAISSPLAGSWTQAERLCNTPMITSLGTAMTTACLEQGSALYCCTGKVEVPTPPPC